MKWIKELESGSEMMQRDREREKKEGHVPIEARRTER